MSFTQSSQQLVFPTQRFLLGCWALPCLWGGLRTLFVRSWAAPCAGASGAGAEDAPTAQRFCAGGGSLAAWPYPQPRRALLQAQQRRLSPALRRRCPA